MKEGFYALSKPDREALCRIIAHEWRNAIHQLRASPIQPRFEDSDTYIRKAAYTELKKLYFSGEAPLDRILQLLMEMRDHANPAVRQTVMNTIGEIAKRDFEPVESWFDSYLHDSHHSVRNAVIGSVKKAGEVNPVPVLKWARRYIHHPEAEIRREICHGIELRGRTHPLEIMPLLKELQFDKKARVRNTLVHVIGQISYKKACLEQVLEDFKTWENSNLVHACFPVMIEVHGRYKNFAFYKVEEAKEIIRNYFPDAEF